MLMNARYVRIQKATVTSLAVLMAFTVFGACSGSDSGGEDSIGQHQEADVVEIVDDNSCGCPTPRCYSCGPLGGCIANCNLCSWLNECW
jgi:hypothetical protein